MTKETYNKAVDTLLDAYNDGRLEHGSCQACAVGNFLGTNKWAAEFATCSGGKQVDRTKLGMWIYRRFKTSPEEVVSIISSSGFTKDEIMAIEFAFENSLIKTEEGYLYWTLKESRKQGQFIGLTAVLDVMAGMVEEPVEVEADHKRLKEVYERVRV